MINRKWRECDTGRKREWERERKGKERKFVEKVTVVAPPLLYIVGAHCVARFALRPIFFLRS